MNLKEAFRCQNRLQSLMEETQGILMRERNVTKVENTALRSKVCPGAEDETTLEDPETEYADQINDLVGLLMWLLHQREQLSAAIRAAKQRMDIDFDGEVSLNAQRQQMAQLFRRMSQIRCSEVVLPGMGTGYKFNAEGNQVSYRCDLRRVTTIHVDRNKVRGCAAGLSRKADEISAQLDRQMVNTEVDYEAPFDVNETFQDILERYRAQAGG